MSSNKAVMSPGGNITSKLLDGGKDKPKRRSLVERELETNMTARVTSPAGTFRTTNNPFKRSLSSKQENDYPQNEKSVPDTLTPASSSPINKMFASNSPSKKKCVKKIKDLANNNTGLNKIGDTNNSSAKKNDKIHKKIDSVQNCETDPKSSEKQNSPIIISKPSTSGYTHNIIEQTPENFCLINNKEDEPSTHIQSFKNMPNGLLGNNSVVKALNFDSKQKEINAKPEDKNEILNIESESEYQIDDLAWARVGNYPFWPCIITRDPNGLFVKKKLFGRVEHYILHVTFFGDNGRRGWVVDNMLRKYLGIKEFLETRDNFTPENKKKDRGFYNAFFISEKKQAIWDISVKEAETVLKEPKQLRIDLLNQMIYEARLSKISSKVQIQPKPVSKSTEPPIDLSLSESLYDTLFSEDDSKDETEKAKKSRKNSLDVSEVVTACLDNMAAKTGLSQIQKQSHMDRWLQKAKSSTPEKCAIKTVMQITPNDAKKEVMAVSSQKKKRQRSSLNSTEHSGSECVSENGISDAESKNGDATNHIYGKEAEMLNGDVFKSKKRLRSKVKKNVNGNANDGNSNVAKNCKDSSKPSPKTKSDLNPKAPSKISTEGNTIVTKPNVQNSKNVRSDYKPCESPTFTQNVFFDENKDDNITIENDIASKKTSYHANDVGCESPTYTQDFMDINDTEVETNQVSGIDKQENMSIDGTKDENQSQKCQEKQQTSSTDLNTENIGSNTDFQPMDISLNESQTKIDKNASKSNLRMDSESNNVDKSVENLAVLDDDNITKDVELFDQSNDELMNKNCNLSKNYKSAQNSQREVFEHIDKQNTSPVNNYKEKNRPNSENSSIAIENNDFELKEINESTKLMETSDNINTEDSEIIDLHNQSIGSDTSASILIDKDLIHDNESVTKSVEDYINRIEDGESITKKGTNKASAKNISLTETGRKSRHKKQNLSKDGQVTYCGDVITNIDDELSINNKDNLVSEFKTKIPESPKTFKLSLRRVKDLVTPEILNTKNNKNHKKSKNKGQRWELKSNDPIDINNPAFVKYFEQKRDDILDENPHLSEEDLLQYLFKTWLYVENLKTDIEKTDQKEQANLVKGLDRECKPKRLTKKVLTLDAFMKIDRTSHKNKEQTHELEQSNLDNGLKEERQKKGISTDLGTNTINENKDKDRTDIENNYKLEQANLVKELDRERKHKRLKQNLSLDALTKTDKTTNKDKEQTYDLEQSNLDKGFVNKRPEKRKATSLGTNTMNEDKNKLEQANTVKGFEDEQRSKKLNKKKPKPEINTYIINKDDDKGTYIEKTVNLQLAHLVQSCDDKSKSNKTKKYSSKSTNSYNALNENKVGTDVEKADKLEQTNLVKELNPDLKPKTKKNSSRSETNTNSKNVTNDAETSDKLEQANLVKKEDLEEEQQQKRIKKKIQSPETNKSNLKTSNKNIDCTDVDKTNKLTQTNLVKELNPDRKPKSKKKNSPRSETNANSKNATNQDEETSDKLEQVNLVTKSKELNKEQQQQKIKKKVQSPETNKSIDKTSNENKDKYSTERNNINNTETLTQIPELKDEVNSGNITKSVDENKILESPKSSKVSHKVSEDSTKLETVDGSSPKTDKIKEKVPKKSKDKTEETKLVTKSGPTNMSNPEFLKYFELKKDVLLDENPHLTEDDLSGYLYKTWLYEENLKTDIEKTDELEQANLVKGLEDEQQPKKIKKKIIRPEKNKERVQKKIDVYFPKEKTKRNIAKAYYNEDDTDIEDEIAMFEIPKQESEETDDITKLQPIVNELAPSFSPHKLKSAENLITHQEVQEFIPVDEQQFYLDQLLQPKPNIFKGLIREKVCLICEKAFNLIKCKGCYGMFHVDCVKNMKEATQPDQLALRNKKKKRGRKSKNASIYDENDETANSNSDENNVSLEMKESNLVVNLDEFESQFDTKMAEILTQNIKESIVFYPSKEGCDWTKTVPGQCEIIDYKTKPKTIEMANFKCHNCQKYDTPVCFVCKSALSPKNNVEYRQRCQVPHCFSYYHLECLDMWPQTQFNAGQLTKCPKSSERFEAITCPRHVCHTCVCDDPRGCKTRFSSDKLAKCVRCPATYHSFTKCLPAGTQVLSASYIICPRHYEISGKVPCHVNTGWCFICALGGTLICCEYCPTSFHAECLNIKPPEGNYMCEDCETGRLPLYGEMVWVKLGHYRWWPGLVLHPCEIPENILAVKHSMGEFVVRFFGQYDYYWVNRGRVFPFQEGDSGRVSSQKSKLDEAFTVAITHAKKAFEILKDAQPNSEEDTDIASSLLPPHYVKLKVNKPVGSVTNWRTDEEDCSLTQCECDPNDEEPCGMYSQCLNRMLLTECGPACRAGDRCHNRAFEKRQYPRLAPYRTPHRGWGLKALQDIKQGEFVIEYVGELIDMAEFQRRMGRKHEMRDENYYFLTLDKDRMIDAGPKGNLARFMNHCCEPNCETQKWTVLGDVRVGLFAINDIPANSEVTFNYNLECAGIEKKKCMCGARRCSGYIGAKPKQDDQPPKPKRTYKKRKQTETPSPTTIKKKNPRAERSRTKDAKPKELTEIEKDLLIINMATNAAGNDCKVSLETIEIDKGLKRKLSEDDDCPLIPKVRKLDSNEND